MAVKAVLLKTGITMSHHLKSTLGCVFVVICLFCACQPNPLVPAIPPDHVALISRESITTTAGITVLADSVNVSICPSNANCFAPNSASVKLQLSKNAQTQSVYLWTFIPNYKRMSSINPPADSVTVAFEGQQYKVILRDGGFRKGPENANLPEAVVQVSRL